MAASSHRAADRINTSKFYQEWKGHPIEDLEKLHTITSDLRPNKPIIYLSGDSSLDNKAWVPSSGAGGEPLPVEVPGIYYHTLHRPRPKPDVAFWMNHFLGERATCINTAIEESTLQERDDGLLAHDQFIHDNISKNDVLVVSIGANDIALRPTLATMWHMLRLAWLTRRSSLANGSAWPLPYFRTLFGTKVQNYINNVVQTQKPRAVIVCMIYYPLEASAGQSSWANMQLKALGYDRWPKQLQAGIKQMYESATKGIYIEGTTVLACPLFEVMDGKNKEEYTARVEPSVEGGRKMAKAFCEILEKEGVLDST